MPNHAELPLWDDKSTEEKLETMRRMLDDLYETVYANARKNILETLAHAGKIFTDEKELADIATMIRLVRENPNILAPNCEVGHITGSALVCDSSGRVLLHYHKKLKRWLQFGGHIEFEMDVADAAMREAQEETGLPYLRHYPAMENPKPIDFDIHTIPATDTRPEHLHLDFRYMLISQSVDHLIPPDYESQDLMWVHYRELLNPTDPDDAKLLDPALIRLIKKCAERFRNKLAYTY